MRQVLDRLPLADAFRAAELLERAVRLEALMDRCRRHAAEQDEAVALLRGSLTRLKARALEREATASRLMAALPPEAPNPAPEPSRPGRGRAAACLLVLLAAAGNTLPPRARAPELPARAAALLTPAAPEALDPSGTEALRLVYGYRSPGSERSLLDVLESSETPGGPSLWKVEPLDGSVYAVTYTPAGYEFEADVARGTVTPAPETLTRLD